ncbi:MAG TPA: hypothetical protein VG186_04875, partial [Solirubrobacteraceae bacterium]|nr:hypothetical protein [Solirubrobacteraceae bacterium]
MATGCSPSFEEIALTDGITAWAAAAEGTIQWWTSALRRGATPPELMVDGIRWWETMTDRRRPTWSSRHEVVFEAPVARLRDFSGVRASEVIPCLVLPPQAGHDSCIVDFTPEQSQMRTILEAGLDRAYTLDWIGAGEGTKNAGIEDYLEVIDRAV